MASALLDGVVVVRILKMLSTPIKDTKAFELGIVDANAKKIKNPSTSAEKNAYSLLQRFVFKVQYALSKSPNMQSKRLLTFAAAMAMLREYKDTDDNSAVQTLLEMYMEDEDVQNQATLLEKYNVLSFKNFITMEEEVAANAVGHGGIHGVGIGTKGEPGVDTLRKWPFPGIGMQSLFRRKPVIKKKKHASK
tara:strand:- start:3021 stop:3596 length:576 start_codon:yes stop_codon:yes gene_type:complete